jgi:acetyl-CoA carboxylase biotin carboxyl carrier protein
MSTDLTHDDVQSILKLIDAAEHLEEIEIVHGPFRLHVIRNGSGKLRGPASTAALAGSAASAPPLMAAKAPAAPTIAGPIAGPPNLPEGAIAIRAPMLGVFYRASAPGEKPFVEAGQRVRADDTVCLIEVMKLFNSIRAGVDGEVIEIMAENGALVEFDQPLIYIKPSKG